MSVFDDHFVRSDLPIEHLDPDDNILWASWINHGLKAWIETIDGEPITITEYALPEGATLTISDSGGGTSNRVLIESPDDLKQEDMFAIKRIYYSEEKVT